MGAILNIRIMRNHNQTNNNQSASDTLQGGIAKQLLGHVIVQRDLGHIQHRATPTQTTHHPFLGYLQDTIYNPFQERQIMQLVGVMLVPVATPIVAINSPAGP